MAFQFIPSGKAVKNSPITWKFESHDTVYQSEQERFERNVEFWRNRMGLSSIERVVTLNGEFQPIEYTSFEEVEEPKCLECKDNPEDCTCPEDYIEYTELKEEIKDEQPIINEPVDSPVISESPTQPSISQDTKAPINTTKRKSRKKTS
jgi:hypothetical protein